MSICNSEFGTCYRLPWRRHALDTKETDFPESEDEIHDLTLKSTDAVSKIDENGNSIALMINLSLSNWIDLTIFSQIQVTTVS